jgi:hypothetical protein
MLVEFGEWTPDLPTSTSCQKADGCLSYGNGYRQMLNHSASLNGLTARCQGAFACFDLEGNSYTFAGDATKLYLLTANTPTNYSRATGYTTITSDFWEFAKYGEKVIATNFHDTPQYINLGATAFADITGAPKARHVAVVRDFVVFGNLFEDSGSVAHRLRWSAKGDETDYTASASTQSDSVDLVGDAGEIQRIVGGEYGVVFQRKSIWRMTYVGAPVFFQLDQVEQGRGAMVPQSVVKVGSMIFFLDTDGFYMFDGYKSTPIGDGKVDKFFLAALDTSYRYRVIGVADPKNKVVIWSYPIGGSVGSLTRQLIYNWTTGRWTSATIALEYVCVGAYLGYTLESVDAVNASIDALTESLDSDYYRGNGLHLGGFDGSHQFGFMDSSAMTATIQTAELTPVPGRKSSITRVRSHVDGGTTAIRVATRNNLASAVSWGSSLSSTTPGSYRPRATARHFTVEASITNGFTTAIGVEIEAKQRGYK